MLKRSGELFTLTTYSAGARDDYEDVAYTYSTGFAKVRGLRLNRDAERQYIDQTGEVSVADVAVLFAYPVKDEQGNAVMRWKLINARPMKWTGPTLAAKGAQGPQSASICTPAMGPKVQARPMESNRSGSDRPMPERRT